MFNVQLIGFGCQERVLNGGIDNRVIYSYGRYCLKRLCWVRKIKDRILRNIKVKRREGEYKDNILRRLKRCSQKGGRK